MNHASAGLEDNVEEVAGLFIEALTQFDGLVLDVGLYLTCYINVKYVPKKIKHVVPTAASISAFVSADSRRLSFFSAQVRGACGGAGGRLRGWLRAARVRFLGIL
jgi:hypothetical protein